MSSPRVDAGLPATLPERGFGHISTWSLRRGRVGDAVAQLVAHDRIGFRPEGLRGLSLLATLGRPDLAAVSLYVDVRARLSVPVCPAANAGHVVGFRWDTPPGGSVRLPDGAALVSLAALLTPSAETQGLPLLGVLEARLSPLAPLAMRARLPRHALLAALMRALHDPEGPVWRGLAGGSSRARLALTPGTDGVDLLLWVRTDDLDVLARYGHALRDLRLGDLRGPGGPLFERADQPGSTVAELLALARTRDTPGAWQPRAGGGVDESHVLRSVSTLLGLFIEGEQVEPGAPERRRLVRAGQAADERRIERTYRWFLPEHDDDAQLASGSALTANLRFSPDESAAGVAFARSLQHGMLDGRLLYPYGEEQVRIVRAAVPEDGPPLPPLLPPLRYGGFADAVLSSLGDSADAGFVQVDSYLSTREHPGVAAGRPDAPGLRRLFAMLLESAIDRELSPEQPLAHHGRPWMRAWAEVARRADLPVGLRASVEAGVRTLLLQLHHDPELALVAMGLLRELCDWATAWQARERRRSGDTEAVVAARALSRGWIHVVSDAIRDFTLQNPPGGDLLRPVPFGSARVSGRVGRRHFADAVAGGARAVGARLGIAGHVIALESDGALPVAHARRPKFVIIRIPAGRAWLEVLDWNLGPVLVSASFRVHPRSQLRRHHQGQQSTATLRPEQRASRRLDTLWGELSSVARLPRQEPGADVLQTTFQGFADWLRRERRGESPLGQAAAWMGGRLPALLVQRELLRLPEDDDPKALSARFLFAIGPVIVRHVRSGVGGGPGDLRWYQRGILALYLCVRFCEWQEQRDQGAASEHMLERLVDASSEPEHALLLFRDLELACAAVRTGADWLEDGAIKMRLKPEQGYRGDLRLLECIRAFREDVPGCDINTLLLALSRIERDCRLTLRAIERHTRPTPEVPQPAQPPPQVERARVLASWVRLALAIGQDWAGVAPQLVIEEPPGELEPARIAINRYIERLRLEPPLLPAGKPMDTVGTTPWAPITPIDRPDLVSRTRLSGATYRRQAGWLLASDGGRALLTVDDDELAGRTRHAESLDILDTLAQVGGSGLGSSLLTFLRGAPGRG